MQIVMNHTPGQRDGAILDFQDCLLPLSGTASETFRIDLALSPGELCLLHCDDQLHEAAVSRAACGLLAPLGGSVRFLGRDWQDLSPDWANAARGRIGVAFRQDGWLPYHSMMENIILAQLHHTRRPLPEIRHEAAVWARRFGLPGLPYDDPAAVTSRDRLCANFARAFLGSPSLIVVEHQARPLPPALLQALINAMREAREAGAAVLWLTRDMAFSLDRSVPASQRVHLGSVRATAVEQRA